MVSDGHKKAFRPGGPGKGIDYQIQTPWGHRSVSMKFTRGPLSACAAMALFEGGGFGGRLEPVWVVLCISSVSAPGAACTYCGTWSALHCRETPAVLSSIESNKIAHTSDDRGFGANPCISQ